MGRCSRRLAGPFLDFARVRPGGCHHSGVGGACLHSGRRRRVGALHRWCAPGSAASKHHLRVGESRRMQHPNASFDACVSALAIDVIPEVDEVAAEMRRVTRPGGVVACACSTFGAGTPLRIWCTIQIRLDESIVALRDHIFRLTVMPPSSQPPSRGGWVGFSVIGIYPDGFAERVAWQPLFASRSSIGNASAHHRLSREATPRGLYLSLHSVKCFSIVPNLHSMPNACSTASG